MIETELQFRLRRNAYAYASRPTTKAERLEKIAAEMRERYLTPARRAAFDAWKRRKGEI